MRHLILILVALVLSSCASSETKFRDAMMDCKYFKELRRCGGHANPNVEPLPQDQEVMIYIMH